MSSELGAVLRAWRDRVDPAEIGLAHNAPRRAAGLRREELALLAGISIDYVIRLEQGRTRTPSAQVCASLARALRLTDEEQAHLFRLAGHALDPERISRHVPAGVRRIVERLHDHPVAVTDAMWTLILANDLYSALFGDMSGWPDRDRNTPWRHFTADGGLDRVHHCPDEKEAFERSMVSDLRASTSRYPRDPELRALVDDLSTASERFRELWRDTAIATHQQSHKTVSHPEVGDVDIDCDVLTTQAGDLRVLVMTPRPGGDGRSKLDLLATLGTQTWAVT